MKRVNLDRAAPSVKRFVRSLPVDREEIALLSGGAVVCRIIPPSAFSHAEKAAYLAELKDMLRRARERNKSVSAADIERDIRAATRAMQGKRR